MKLSQKAKIWLGLAAVVSVFWVVFLFAVSVDPVPVEEQLVSFGEEVYSKDLWHRAVLLHGIGDLEESARLYDAAIEREPDTAMYHLYRGKLRYDLDDYDGAIEEFSRAVELEPDQSWALNARAIARYQKGDREGCLADLDAAMELEPDELGPNLNLAVIQRIEGDPEGALEVMLALEEQAAPQVPAHRLLDNLSQTYFELGRYDDALETITEIIQNYPEYIDAWKNRSEVYRAMNRMEEARADQERYKLLQVEYKRYAEGLK